MEPMHWPRQLAVFEKMFGTSLRLQDQGYSEMARKMVGRIPGDSLLDEEPVQSRFTEMCGLFWKQQAIGGVPGLNVQYGVLKIHKGTCCTEMATAIVPTFHFTGSTSMVF